MYYEYMVAECDCTYLHACLAGLEGKKTRRQRDDQVNTAIKLKLAVKPENYANEANRERWEGMAATTTTTTKTKRLVFESLSTGVSESFQS